MVIMFVDQWGMFGTQNGTLLSVLPGFDPFDNFFENDSSSPDNDSSGIKREGNHNYVTTFLPPENEVFERNVFTGVCLSTGGGGTLSPLFSPQGEVFLYGKH